MRRLLPLLASAAVLHGGNKYELFAYTGFEQETFSAKADILFVIDNSASMVEETEALADSFAAFAQLLSADASQFPTEDLSDAATSTPTSLPPSVGRWSTSNIRESSTESPSIPSQRAASLEVSPS